MPLLNVSLPDVSCFDHLLGDSASSDTRDDEALAAAAVEAPCERPVTMFFT